MLQPTYSDKPIRESVRSANQTGTPLYLVMLATRPCYIKLASLVMEMQTLQIPCLIINVGQHYDDILIGPMRELGYATDVHIHLNIRGEMAERTADLAHKLMWLHKYLSSLGLKEPAIPLVSGDTSTAGSIPFLWNLITAKKSIHVEAGLRSFTPFENYRAIQRSDISSQRERKWRKAISEPFPEGICTRMASVGSELFFAPVQQNVDNLLQEGYEAEKIFVSGSLSADAVTFASDNDMDALASQYPALTNGKWLRVDLHRRENMTRGRLEALLGGLILYASNGGKVIFILTNAVQSAIKVFDLDDIVDQMTKKGILVQPMWASYNTVISFVKSDLCLALYTDSGGLQEEAHILNKPCVTCRFSTDRPETILEAGSNILLPPADKHMIAEFLLGGNLPAVRTAKDDRQLYGGYVGRLIAKHLNVLPVKEPVMV